VFEVFSRSSDDHFQRLYDAQGLYRVDMIVKFLTSISYELWACTVLHTSFFRVGFPLFMLHCSYFVRWEISITLLLGHLSLLFRLT
jgi:hypothetical protein